MVVVFFCFRLSTADEGIGIHHHHHHLFLYREGRGGTIDDSATSFIHFPLFSKPLQFAFLYGGQEVFVWSNCLLDLDTDFLVGNTIFMCDT